MKRKEFEEKAARFVLDQIEDEDIICNRLQEIPEEKEYCARFCKNMRNKCAIRYINNY